MPRKVTCEFVNITPEKAKELLGYEESPEGTYIFPGFTPDQVSRFDLTKNGSNRPMKDKRYLRYAEAMLSGQWRETLESLTFRLNGQVVSGASRLLALIYVDTLCAIDPEYATSLGWDGKRVTLPNSLLAYGVLDEAADATDTGEPRKAGDVFFRIPGLFGEYSLSVRKSLARELGVACRLVSLRSHGETVKGSQRLEHWELTNLFRQHPKIVTVLEALYEIDTGDPQERRRITSRISLGYATAITYLAACDGGEKVQFTNSRLNTMKEFWKLFAANLHTEGNVIRSLWTVLNQSRIREGFILDRDALVSVVIRAIQEWLADPEKAKSTPKQLLRNIGEERPRFGGLDGLFIREQ